MTPLKGRQGKGGNVRKATATKAKGSPRRSSGGAGRAGAVAHLASNFRKALVKGPTAKQRRLFKLSKVAGYVLSCRFVVVIVAIVFVVGAVVVETVVALSVMSFSFEMVAARGAILSVRNLREG